MICAGRTDISVSDESGTTHTFNVAMNEYVTSFYGWGWKEFLITSNSKPGDFLMFQMTNNPEIPIKVGCCKSATMSQFSNVQSGTLNDSDSESSDEEPDQSDSSDGEPDQGCMIFLPFFAYALPMMQNA
jgi:hypothetical protein